MLSEKAPFLIISFLSILGAVPGLFLPETADLKMPDSLDDIDQFGRHDRFFWMPLCQNKRRFKKSYNQQLEIKQNEAFESIHDILMIGIKVPAKE